MTAHHNEIFIRAIDLKGSDLENKEFRVHSDNFVGSAFVLNIIFGSSKLSRGRR